MDSEKLFYNVVDFIKRHRKALIIFIALILIVLIVIAIIEAGRNASLHISVTPTDSIVTINGKTYENGNTYQFHPGTITATVSKEGFDSKEITLELQSHKTTELSAYLTQGQSLEWYNSHKTDLYSLQNIYNNDLYTDSTDDLDSFFDDYYQIVSLKDSLPIAEFIPDPENPSANYSIIIKEDSRPDCERFLCLLVIDETERFHQEALQILTQHGFSPDDYEIRYSNTATDF